MSPLESGGVFVARVEIGKKREKLVPATNSVFTKEIFKFFRELKRHNKKTWMDANRERYQETVCKPFRRLVVELSPEVLKLDSRFDVAARKGKNISRINRASPFVTDKTT